MSPTSMPLSLSLIHVLKKHITMYLRAEQRKIENVLRTIDMRDPVTRPFSIFTHQNMVQLCTIYLTKKCKHRRTDITNQTARERAS